MINDKPIPTMCCVESMVEQVPNTEDGAYEKHIPVYSIEGNVDHVSV